MSRWSQERSHRQKLELKSTSVSGNRFHAHGKSQQRENRTKNTSLSFHSLVPRKEHTHAKKMDERQTSEGKKGSTTRKGLSIKIQVAYFFVYASIPCINWESASLFHEFLSCRFVCAFCLKSSSSVNLNLSARSERRRKRRTQRARECVTH